MLYLGDHSERIAVRFFLFLSILFLHLFGLSAQSPAYVHYGVGEGLPSNKVYCALQDYRGFIWFGTDKGLARFDGTRFQIFGIKEGLPDPEVLSLFEDSQHRLWISCFSHRPCYMKDGQIISDKTDSLFERVNLKASLWQFSEDRNQKVWIAGKSKSVFVFDGKSVEVETYEKSVIRMAQMGGYNFALGTTIIFQKELGIHYDVSPSLIGGISVVTSNNHILYALTDKLILLEWVGGKIVERSRVESGEGRVFTDNHNHFWHCTDTKGALRYEVIAHRLAIPTQFLPDEHVNGMLEDNQGTLWFCTGDKGVYVLSPGKAATFTKADGLRHNNITTITGNQKGDVLAGDDGGIFYKFAGTQIQTIALSRIKENNRTRQIIPLSGDSNWIATDKGLFIENQNKAIRVNPPGSKYFSGFKSILANPDYLWYANHYSLGIIEYSQKNPRILIQNRTTALGIDSEGFIWSGRLDGLYSQADSFQYNWGEQFPKLKNRIVAIQNAGGQKIWVVTPEGGLLRGTVVKGSLTQVISVNDSLYYPIESIQSLFLEKQAGGRLWMATNSGVYGLNPDNWNVIHFDNHDGLADNDVNCVWVANDTLWAGTPLGLSCLPLLMQNSTTEFSTFVTGVHYQLGGELVYMNLLDSYLGAHNLELPPDAAMLTLNFAGLNYRHQGNLGYECITTKRMPPVLWWTRNNLFTWISRGFGSEQDTTIINENSMNFGISPPSGSFRIKVTAVAPQGAKSQFSDEWVITVRPYWYNRLM